MRPFSEAATITADMVDWREQFIHFERHKNARMGKSRTVYCPPELMAMLRRLAERHPAGSLFRNRDGEPWRRQIAFARLAAIRKPAGLRPFSMYAFRHSYISDAIERGVPAPTIAEVVTVSQGH